MMSRPSAATQRVYGESFSVANFAARLSLTSASLAMQAFLVEACAGPA